MSKNNVIVLTGRDNFVWTSMQEIIPMIEHAWNGLCESNGDLITTIDVDHKSPASHIKELINSDLIVVTCFNAKIARFIKILRQQLKIDTRIAFYLHGLATIGLWPLERFEILHLMTTNDFFIGTCEGDIKSLQLCFKNARAIKIPFTLIDPPEHVPVSNVKKPFVFIGRISPQKNLDQLIISFSELPLEIRKSHPLWLYGKEDHLGFPNLGIRENLYQHKLEELVNDLSLQNQVVFKGFVDRREIQNELGSDYIFVSPSTHSDENFGMAAFRALLSGATCVLSDWGGHREFKQDFSSQIHYLTPLLNSNGPQVDISDLKNQLLNSLKNQNPVRDLPANFSLKKIYQQLSIALKTPPEHQDPLEPTELAQNIISQQKYFEAHNDIQRCFKSFDDPVFISFFMAYSE